MTPRLLPALLLPLLLAACGTDQFERELALEESGVRLAREADAGDYGLITAAELKARIDAGDDFVLVDAMPFADSFAKGHLPGAVNFLFPVPVMDRWDAAGTDGKSLEDYRALLGDDLDREVITYCGFVKCTRSHNAAVFARQLGFTKVTRFPGGIFAWKGAGFPVVAD